MFLRKASFFDCVKLFVHLAISAMAEDLESQNSIYDTFRVPRFPWNPKDLTRNLKHRNYTKIQMDVFIGSKAADSRLVNLIVKAFSRKNTLVVSGSSETEQQRASVQNINAALKLRNLIVVYDTTSSIDIKALKTGFGDRWSPRARVLACVENIDNATATEILANFWKYDLLNVALTVLNETSEFTEIFIYNPFVPKELFGSRGTLEKLVPGDFPFPDKLNNLYNITIPISLYYRLPKVRLTRNHKTLKDGTDVEALRVLSKKLNFHVELKTASVYASSYTVRLPTGEKVGMIGDVLTNRSDIVFTAQFLESMIGRRVEYSRPMLQSGYCVLVPKAKVMPMIVRMVAPFSLEIWLAMTAVVVFLLVCLTLMGEKQKLVRICRLLLQQIFGKIPKRTFNRIFGISCIFWAYLMACFYQAHFINELIYPHYYKDVDTLKELYERNSPLIVSDNMMAVLNNSQVSVLKNIAKSAIENAVFDDCLYQLLNFGNVSCAVDQFVGDSRAQYHKKRDGTPLLYRVKECLSLHWDVYVARDGFPYLDKFNRLILHLLEAGLYNKWAQDLTTTDRWLLRHGPRTKALTLEHCEGLFSVLGLGLAISTLAFILELVTIYVSIYIPKIVSGMKKKLL